MTVNTDFISLPFESVVFLNKSPQKLTQKSVHRKWY